MVSWGDIAQDMAAGLRRVRDLIPWPSRPHVQRWVGLDLGSHAIKLAEVEQTATGYRLIKTLIQDLSWGPDAASGARPESHPAAAPRPLDFAGWLQAALKEFAADELHVSLSGPEVALRRVHLPLMSRRELLEAARWQLKDQISFPVQEAVVDVQLLGEVWDKDIKKQDVLVAAASRAAVDGAVQLVEQAGGRVASVTPAPLALWRSVETFLPEARHGSVAVLEIGGTSTQITIAHQGRIRLVRDLGIGSATVTEALVGMVASEQGEVSIDLAKAEALKRRYGVVKETAEGTTDEGVPLFHLSALMRPVLEQLVTEVSRALDFYRVEMEEAGVGRILLCGGGSNVKQLRAFLADGLGVKVELWNPLPRIPDRVQALEPEQVTEHGPRLAVALGLALEHGQTMRLITPRPRQRAAELPRLQLPAGSWRMAAASVGGMLAAAFLWMLGTLGVLQLRLNAEQRRWRAVEPAHAAGQQAAQAVAAAEAALSQVEAFRAREPVWDGVLKELGRLMPSTVELTELAVSADGAGDGRVHVKGRVTLGGRPERVLGQLVDGLNQSAFFSSVELAGSEIHTTGTAGATYELDGRLE